MKNAIIIGAGGFVGIHLARHLQSTGKYRVIATKLPQEHFSCGGVEVFDLDILDRDAVAKLFNRLQPDCIFHLAAQSSVALSWKNPSLTIDVNIKGCVNVLETVRLLDYSPRMLLIGSGEEYGHVKAGEIPVSEQSPLRPGNIYAATKVCQNMIGKIFADAYDMDVVMIRAFNHIGPGQSDAFVVSDFCRQVAEIEKGRKDPVVFVGNLGACRDFTDVRDIVGAYGLLMETGERGETYNVGSGKAVSIQSLLDLILSKSTRKIEVRVDPLRFRPMDVPTIEADIGKLVSATGWTRKIPLEQTIQDTLDFWRHMN